jgi:antitoxin Phd
MTKHWAVQDAKARFSELLEASVTDGPQIITKRGVETAVFVSIGEWQRLQDLSKSIAEKRDGRPSLKDLLLNDPRRFELDIPPRGRMFTREPPEFD